MREGICVVGEGENVDALPVQGLRELSPHTK